MSKYHNDDKLIFSIIRFRVLHVTKDMKDEPSFQANFKLQLISGPLAIPLVKTSKPNQKHEMGKYTPLTRGSNQDVVQISLLSWGKFGSVYY